ncbi:nuclear envelope integral membrane protein 2 isoform X1 [Acipenser ruthenus]|uniref:nuclear envelope integral membrane protein 2 isoform X1 n=1 Tax=Acipenser ruthenus TaxID=7906 RepID=UPI0027413D36|nr:nuclear envelope integral membrane protein 2 isoform X1 [Acipenser ruthenus]
MKALSASKKYMQILGVCLFLFVQTAWSNTFKECIEVIDNLEISQYQEHCFCYSLNTTVGWKDIWSTFQVNVQSQDDVHIVFPVEDNNCKEPETFIHFIQCVLRFYWPFPKASNEPSLTIAHTDEEVCFGIKSTKPSVKYSVHVTRKKHDLYRLSLFVIGILLLFSARRLCRNTVFYYTVGISLGILSIFILTLFVLRRFTPKKKTFLFMLSGCSYLSYMAVQQVVNHWDEIRTDYWRYAVGYLLFSGFLSFAVCYKHGPITNKQSLNLLTWTLQIIALLLMYLGITYPPAAYAVISILVASKALAFSGVLICRIIRGIFQILKKSFKAKELEIRLLSEEEYRKQGDTETRASLQELRENCLSPEFPAWEAVSRLRSPKRLAEFIRGGSHVTDEEILEHDKQYCLGGTYFEDWIFSSRDEEQGDQDWPNPLQSQEDVDEEDLEYYQATEQRSLAPVDLELF